MGTVGPTPLGIERLPTEPPEQAALRPLTLVLLPGKTSAGALAFKQHGLSIDRKFRSLSRDGARREGARGQWTLDTSWSARARVRLPVFRGRASRLCRRARVARAAPLLRVGNGRPPARVTRKGRARALRGRSRADHGRNSHRFREVRALVCRFELWAHRALLDLEPATAAC